MTEAVSPSLPIAPPPCEAAATTKQAGPNALEPASPTGCNAFNPKTCEAVAQRVVELASASAGRAAAPTDTPAALRSMATLTKTGALQLATPSQVKPGPDGVAVRPNERFVSVQGTINGVQGTLLTAVAERANANSPWRMTYTVGAGGVQLRIEQQPIAGQPGRFKTTIGPLDPAFDFGSFGPPLTTQSTGPLVVQPASDGRGATATIDGGQVFPALYRTR